LSKATILQEIMDHKSQEVASNSARRSLSDLESECSDGSDIRPFLQSLRQRIANREAAVIAEIKKASPSKGLIRPDFDPVFLAQDYARAGANCLSVLTDENYFQGHNDFLKQARCACTLPVLRKDFMVDPYQIVESRWLGADCILLIVAALETPLMNELASCARDLGMDILVEVHNEAELEIGLGLGTDLIGINNRDLHTFTTDLNTTYRLLPLMPENTMVITESGINQRADILAMQDHGVYGYLIGESFMRAESPGKKLRQVVYGDD
jgi:indole-3-glycerol phosphate synthase